MSPGAFKMYNRVAEEMDYFHQALRASWEKLWAEASGTSHQLSTASLVSLGLQFCNHLHTHHSIEEAYLFPVLGKKMPNFRPGHFATEQHKDIHSGLDRVQSYLEACQKGESDLQREKLQQLMDVFGKVLWQHMDDEVRELGAENMKEYWTEQEMKSLPF